MTPNTATPGRSLKGAALYLLHDKRSDRQAEFNELGNPGRDIWDLQTVERVAFIETENLPTDNPRLAVACMIDTATNAAELKRANGLKATPVKKPSYHYSLSWPYEQGQEPPDKEEMMRCARETLALQGLQDHQAIFIVHEDEPQPHIHVLVNLVHPVTGKRNSLSKNRIKLSEWAQKYEEDQGQILCPQRVINNALRAQGQFVKYDGIPRAEYERRAQYEKDGSRAQKMPDDLKPGSPLKQALEAHWQGFRAARHTKWQEMRAQQKPDWAALHARQRAELQEFDNHYVGRVKFALKQNRGRVIGAAVRALFGNYSLRRELLGKHLIEREQQAERNRSETYRALDEVYIEHKAVSDHIIGQHREQWDKARQNSPTRRQRAVQKQQAEKQTNPRPRSTPTPEQAPQPAVEAPRLDPKDLRANFDQARSQSGPEPEKKTKGQRKAQQMRNRSKTRKPRTRNRDRDRDRER